MRTAEVVRFRLHPLTHTQAATVVMDWAVAGQSRVVLAANVHMVMEAWDDPVLSEQLRAADLAVPDGAPLVWALRALGEKAEHVRGADLTLGVCRQAEKSGVPVGLYGSAPETLEAFQAFLDQRYPDLRVPFVVSPPFRPFNDEEDRDMIEAINGSGARILFVSLGCPKQERWMMEHREKVPCVMLGVGAAFDFFAGTVSQAPRWMQRVGLEWVFRLASDPRRLWKRYLKHNPRFIVLFGLQFVAHLFGRDKKRSGG
jgi:N-acetylglucosaminyldiphosphoundecaprenol N-acetyl-beta-D-mannosaminyltransferase